MQNLKEYKSPDFYQSVVLKSAGLTLLRLEKKNDRFFIFVFDDSNNEAKEIIKSYWSRKLQLVARDLIESINELKTRIHSGV